MRSIETATGSFSEHLACKRRSSGANYVRRREATERATPSGRRFAIQIPPLVEEAIKNITNFWISIVRPVCSEAQRTEASS